MNEEFSPGHVNEVDAAADQQQVFLTRSRLHYLAEAVADMGYGSEVKRAVDPDNLRAADIRAAADR